MRLRKTKKYIREFEMLSLEEQIKECVKARNTYPDFVRERKKIEEQIKKLKERCDDKNRE